MGSVNLQNGGGSAFASSGPNGTSSVTVNGVTKTSGGGSSGSIPSRSSLGPAISAAGNSVANMPSPGKAKLEALGKSVATDAIASGQTSGLDAMIKQRASALGGAGGGANKSDLMKQIEAFRAQLGAGGSKDSAPAGESTIEKLSAEVARLQAQINQLKGSPAY
jgi:hypothetical protein